MSKFIEFMNTESGEIVSYPEHFKDHPVLGLNLEVFNAEEHEVDKVVTAGHELPVEQRVSFFAAEVETETNNENDEED